MKKRLLFFIVMIFMDNFFKNYLSDLDLTMDFIFVSKHPRSNNFIRAAGVSGLQTRSRKQKSQAIPIVASGGKLPPLPDKDYSTAVKHKIPQRANIIHGDVSITSTDKTLNINQRSQKSIINWQSFNVGKGNTVRFNQPNADSVSLNRVTGSMPSTIAGLIQSNGRVLLVNPNGIIITKNGAVRTYSFVASTLNIKDDDFKRGIYDFHGNGIPGKVLNEGNITVDGGFTALLGGSVENKGLVKARVGKVAFGAGERIVLDFSGSNFLQVALPSEKAKVVSSGKVVGKEIYVKARHTKKALRDVVNISGSMKISKAVRRNGKIVLSGNGGIRIKGARIRSKSGKIRIIGRKVKTDKKTVIDTSGEKGGTVRIISTEPMKMRGTYRLKGIKKSGGRLDVTAKELKVEGAKIDASGVTKGGLVRLGGEFQGGDPKRGEQLDKKTKHSFLTRWGEVPDLPSATDLYIDEASSICASASKGNGGTVIMWSENTTFFDGTIDVRGIGGIGGSVEISGKNNLGASILPTSNLFIGSGGNLLLDPKNISVGNAPGESNPSVNLVGWAIKLALSATDSSISKYFGWSIALSRNNDAQLMAIGCPREKLTSAGAEKGAVYLYTISDKNFGNSPALVGVIGDGVTNKYDINVSLAENDLFGSSVALSADGNVLAVGATGVNTNVGAVFMFKFPNQNFTNGAQKLKLTHGTGNVPAGVSYAVNAGFSSFGRAVALSGDANILVVGGNTVNDKGAIAVYKFTNTDFTAIQERKNTIDDVIPSRRISKSIATF